MALSPQDRERLADIVERQPTKNRELQEAWGLESGSEVHQYLESSLREYYYRDENSLIRATAEAEALLDGETDPDSLTIQVSGVERDVFAVVPGPEERSESVVSILHRVRSERNEDPSVDEVRRALGTLERKGAVSRVMRTVPTYRLAVPRSDIVVTEPDDS